MSDSNKENKITKWSEILVAFPTKNMFKEYCKVQGVEMRVAADEILLFIIKNKIPLNSLSDMMDKNITKEVKKSHHNTVGFLQDFRKEMLGIANKLTAVDSRKGWLEGGVLRVYLKDIYLVLQQVLKNSPDEKNANKYLAENEENIKKADINEVNNVWDKGGILRVLLEEIYRDLVLLMLENHEDEEVQKLLKKSTTRIKNAFE
jgi:hypothetical protein